jgi:hypothetical protein
MADVRDDPAGELEWDLRALYAADSLSDERVQEHHGSLAVQGFYPSLHLNLGEDYRKMGDRPAPANTLSWHAKSWTRSAAATTPRGSDWP